MLSEQIPFASERERVKMLVNTRNWSRFRQRAQITADTIPNIASPYRPPAKLPVASLAKPTYQGPKKPPRLPRELIQAIAAAAAGPVRNIGGIAQNRPLEP